MKPPTKILFLEDNSTDLELMQNELKIAHVAFTSVVIYMKKDFLAKVSEFKPDVILSDYSLPSFDGMQAFKMVKERHAYIPFILVTGVLSEQVAIECLKEGVDDFILKPNYKRLPIAIQNAIRKMEIRKEKMKMTSALKKSHEELRYLLNNRDLALEEERLYVARELHDELGQELTALKIDISMFGKKVLSGKSYEKEVAENELKQIMDLVDTATRSVKRISSGLRPEILDELGLIEAIKWMASDFERRNKVVCKAVFPENISFNKTFTIMLFRIVQETLTNVARHAEATKVKIEMSVNNDMLHLEISDNGKGIQLEKILSSTSLGIIGLRERVGSLKGEFKIQGKKGSGTVVSAVIPLRSQPAIKEI